MSAISQMSAPSLKTGAIFSNGGGDALVGEVLSFLALPSKWCHGRGGPAKVAAVLNALQILRLLRDLGYDRLEVFPDPAGGVLLSGFYGDASVEILCRQDKDQYDFVLEPSGQDDEVYENVEQSVVLKNLWELSCARRKKSSDYYTPAFIVKSSIDSKVWHSKILTTAYQSSMQNAPNVQVDLYAPTVQDFTKTYLGNLQYIGAYGLPTSHQIPALSKINRIQGTNVIGS